MNKFKYFLLIIGVLNAMSLIVSVFYKLSFVKYVNSLFTFSLILLIYSGFIFLNENGAFSITRYTFKKFFSIFSNTSVKHIDEDNITENDNFDEKKEKKKIEITDYLKVEKKEFTLPLLLAAIVNNLLSICISLYFF